MTTAVCFDLIAVVKTVPSYARSWSRITKEWVVDGYYARRIAEEMAAHGCLITGLEPKPERRKQQRNEASKPENAKTQPRCAA